VGDPPFEYQRAEALLRQKRETVVEPGTRLDRSFLQWCRESGFSGTEILSLFPKGGGNGREPAYKCDVQCPSCRSWRTEDLGISAVRELISVARRTEPVEFDFKFRCASCEEAEQRRRDSERGSHSTEALLARMRSADAQKRKARAEMIVSQCLSRSHTWRNDIPEEKRFAMLTKEPFDEELVAAAIQQMAWKDFFATPYWHAVHDEALRRVRGKCVVCAGSEPLRVHYRTNDLHGFEHTERGMRELLFLCKHCEMTSALRTKWDSN
jgi:hypothetical protein